MNSRIFIQNIIKVSNIQRIKNRMKTLETVSRVWRVFILSV